MLHLGNTDFIIKKKKEVTMETLIKWPGGKSGEIDKFKDIIPKFDRYIEPFFGGGAVFFYLKPKKAVINDISTNLIDFYRLTKEQNITFKLFLEKLNSSFQNLINQVDEENDLLVNIFFNYNKDELKKEIRKICSSLFINPEILEKENDLEKTIEKYVIDKFERTIKNNEKKTFNKDDLKENLLTGFTSAYFMYQRNIYNKIASGEIETSNEFKIANFYFIREYCYGSMFRYNSKGEFNIPYGGMSYNRKNFESKIQNIFSKETQKLFSETEIYCEDFQTLIRKIDLTENDFMFLDPPYDTDFSDYEGREFGKEDQIRLEKTLEETKAKFILVIKKTNFINDLYKDKFNIISFDKHYTYNVRDRNERGVEHLIITNMKEEDYKPLGLFNLS
jgi:DNA adenine methylase